MRPVLFLSGLWLNVNIIMTVSGFRSVIAIENGTRKKCTLSAITGCCVMSTEMADTHSFNSNRILIQWYWILKRVDHNKLHGNIITFSEYQHQLSSSFSNLHPPIYIVWRRHADELSIYTDFSLINTHTHTHNDMPNPIYCWNNTTLLWSIEQFNINLWAGIDIHSQLAHIRIHSCIQIFRLARLWEIWRMSARIWKLYAAWSLRWFVLRYSLSWCLLLAFQHTTFQFMCGCQL